MKYNAICFDMDGVIINSEPSHYAAFKHTLEQHGHTLTPKQYELYFAGTTDERGFNNYLRHHPIQATIADLLTEKSASYMTIASAGLIPYPDTVLTIQALRRMVPLAVVTGSTLVETSHALDFLHIRDHFTAVVTANDVTTGKPDPEGYLLAASRLGFESTNCVAIEDSPSGVAAAKAAGMYCVALTTTHAATELQDADTILPRLQPNSLNFMNFDRSDAAGQNMNHERYI